MHACLKLPHLLALTTVTQSGRFWEFAMHQHLHGTPSETFLWSAAQPVNGVPYSIERLLAGKDGTIQRLQAECFSLKHAGVPAKAQLDEKSLAAFCIVSVC